MISRAPMPPKPATAPLATRHLCACLTRARCSLGALDWAGRVPCNKNDMQEVSLASQIRRNQLEHFCSRPSPRFSDVGITCYGLTSSMSNRVPVFSSSTSYTPFSVRVRYSRCNSSVLSFTGPLYFLLGPHLADETRNPSLRSVVSILVLLYPRTIRLITSTALLRAAVFQCWVALCYEGQKKEI